MSSARAISTSVSERRPGLDALRVAATLLVVMLHAAVPYTVAPMPGLTWPVRHTAVSPVVDFLFWGIEGAIMPLFFVLSGYGAAQSLAHRPADFLSTRWRRLGWPLIAAAAVILPIELYVWLIGWAADGQIAWQKLRSLKLGAYHADLWGLSHLWYLEYLLIYCVALWALRPDSTDAGGRVGGFATARTADGTTLSRRRTFHKTFRPGYPMLAIGVLWLAPEIVVGFQHGFLPFPLKCLYCGLFFAFGVREFHDPAPLAPATRSTLAAAACLLMGLMPLIHRQAAGSLSGTDRILLAAGLASYAILVTDACLRSALSSQIAVAPWLSCLAKASFWIYLVHHPVVAIWQIGLRFTGWPALLQFAVATVGTLACSLASYEWVVRRTRLGEFLDGRRTTLPAEAAAAAPATPIIPLRRAA